MVYHLEWTDKKGGWHRESSSLVEPLQAKLKTLRCEAKLLAVDPSGTRERIGGCEPANSTDDKRIKWNWWYDNTITDGSK